MSRMRLFRSTIAVSPMGREPLLVGLPLWP